MSSGGSKISIAFLWKFLERFGVQSVQFVLQIVLARLLAPEHYGVLSLMIIFTTLANVFVQTGFNTALVQNKDVTEDDYSSVFWVSLFVATMCYVLIFVSAPFIASFYVMPDIVVPLRVLALILFPGTLNSVQLAKVSREMDFRKVFTSNIGAVIISGIISIIIAYMGGGLWALVMQNISNIVMACIVMRFTVKLHLKFVCNLKRVKVLFSYGWKLLITNLLETLYQDLRSLIIGKRYDSGTLGYYNRGKQFPQFVINTVNGTVKSVMLPAFAAEQDNNEKVKSMMRISIKLSTYILFPVMLGLAAVSESLVSLLLTDKWLPCVPYIRIYCVSLAFHPIHSCNLQAINALGRSDIYLKLEVIKKIIGISSLIAVVILFDSAIAIALTGVFTSFTSCFINAYPNRKLVRYTYLEQAKDLLPSIIISVIMALLVETVNFVRFGNITKLIIQVILGVVVYLLLSVLTRNSAFGQLINVLKSYMNRKNK